MGLCALRSVRWAGVVSTLAGSLLNRYFVALVYLSCYCPPRVRAIFDLFIEQMQAFLWVVYFPAVADCLRPAG